MTLTVKRIERLRKTQGRYLDEDGLYLITFPTGSAHWEFRYQSGGNKKAGRKSVEHWMGLGSLAAFNLDEARERARKARQQLTDGIDPIIARRAEREAQRLAAAKTLTFEDAATQYNAHHEEKWSNAKHRAAFLSSLRQPMQ